MEKGGNVTPSGGLGGFCPGGGDRGEEGGLCACGRLLDMVEVHVSPTTGGQFQLRVASSDSIEYLRRLVSKRLRVPKERICLLYRDRHLRDGTLEENSILDGARITLLPSVETGLLTQRPEQSVMQALESLNDGQVNDFLTGKAPLNLTMRLGDHMMLIQLQLSTVSPTSSRKSGSSSSRMAASTSSSSAATTSPQHHEHHHHHHHHYYHHYHHSHSHPPTCGGVPSSSQVGTFTPSPTNSWGGSGPASPHSVLGVCGGASPPPSPSSSSSSIHHYHHHVTSNTSGASSPPVSPFLSTPPHHHSHHHHHHAHHQRTPTSTPNSSPSTSSSASSSPLSEPEPPIRGCPHQSGASGDPKASLDTKALAEASRNLTQTLKQLSSEVLTTKPADKEASRPSSVPERRKTPDRHVASSCSTSKASKRQGAIIESMHHHGKGVYSGTFSGTLNPALQDRQGRPKRDISTIIHILNDLLCATPQYRRHSSTSHTATASTTTTSTNNSHNSSNLSTQSKQPTANVNLEEMYSAGEEDSGVDDNQITRTKLEHLRLIMEQRRARRKARREARASPYSHSSATTSWSSETTTLVASKTTTATGSTTTIAAESSAKAIEVEGSEKESGDASSLCEINTGTVVA